VLDNFSHDAVCGSLLDFLGQLDEQDSPEKMQDAEKEGQSQNAEATEQA
jgi:hypothetical protein